MAALFAAALFFCRQAPSAEPGKSVAASPHRAAKSAAPVNPLADPSAVTPRESASHSRAEYADGYPTSRKAAADLLLAKDEERKSNAWLAYAQGLLAEDDAETDEALAKYRQSFDLDPSNSELAVKVASMLITRDDPSGAIQILKDNIKAAPSAPLPLVVLSKVYAANLKKPDLALKYAEQALALDPNYFPSYYGMYTLLTSQGQRAKAAQILQRAAKASSTDPAFWLGVGQLFAASHFKEDGTPDAPENLKQANALFRKAVEFGQNNADVLAKAADYFGDTRQVKEALSAYAAAAALKTSPDGETALARSRERLLRTFSQPAVRDAAIESLEQITKADPGSPHAWQMLGELYQSKDESEKALAAFQRSAANDATGPQTLLRVAQLQIEMKLFDQAVETAQAARAKYPDAPETHYMLAMALGLAKRKADAVTAFESARKEFETSGHEEFLNAAFYFEYGAAAEQAGLRDKAEELLKQAIELDPKNAAQACNYLGYMWADRGEHLDEAAKMINRALEEDPDNGAFMDSLGWLYFRSGQFDKAVAELKEASEKMTPEDATVLDHLGDAYQKTGKLDEALTVWQKAVSLHQPDLDEKKVSDKIDAAKKETVSKPAPTDRKAP